MIVKEAQYPPRRRLKPSPLGLFYEPTNEAVKECWSTLDTLFRIKIRTKSKATSSGYFLMVSLDVSFY